MNFNTAELKNILNPMEVSNLQNVFPISSSNINSNAFDKNIVFNAFIGQFVKSEFLEQIINVTLFPSDLNIANSKSSDTIKYIGTFLNTLYSEVSQTNFNITGIPKNVILTLIRVTQQVIGLRSDVSVHLLSYETIFQHFPKRDMATDKILRSVVTNKLLNYVSNF